MVIDQTMSDFDQMQAEAFQELTHIIQTKKIPNALLFYGNENTGRKDMAVAFAKGCNCLNGSGVACGNCRSCKKIDGKSHPDILCVAPQKGKKIISISQIRELGAALSSKPNEANFRMVLISQADAMNVQAQNALLKMLEEPPEKTFFILIADKIAGLLPTITSRCRKIRFKPMTDKVIELHLINGFTVDPDLARIVSKTVDSDLKMALRFLNLDSETKDTDWIKRRKWLLDSLSRIIKPDAKSVSNGLTLSQKLSLDPDLMDDSIAMMKTFFRDLMIFKIHPKKIVNLDFFDTFSDIIQIVPQKKFFKWIKDLYETEKKLTSNCGIRLTLDSFFLKIAGNKGNIVYD